MMGWCPRKNEQVPSLKLPIAPETLGLEDEFSLWEGLLVGAMLVF